MLICSKSTVHRNTDLCVGVHMGCDEGDARQLRGKSSLVTYIFKSQEDVVLNFFLGCITPLILDFVTFNFVD